MSTRPAPAPRHARALARLAVALAVMLGLLGLSTGASAGGWAVTTLDAIPAPTPGTPVDVGFTIRQHGVTPVDLDDVAIEVTSAAGTTEVFPAAQQGLTGHYVAHVVFPTAGTFAWEVRQGWFEPQDLGTLIVAGTGDAGGTSTNYRYPAIVRYGLPALALMFGAVAAADVLMGVRRRRAVVA